jgi:hypothetical protein
MTTSDEPLIPHGRLKTDKSLTDKPPEHTTSMKVRNYDATTAEGLAFALLGCLNFGPDGKSLPTFQREAIDLIQHALNAARRAGTMTDSVAES